MLKVRPHMPMRDAVRLLRSKWTADSIMIGFRTGTIRSWLQIDGRPTVPIPMAYWNDARANTLIPETLTLGHLTDFIGPEIQLIKATLRGDSDVGDLKELEVLRQHFAGFISNQTQGERDKNLRDAAIEAFEFLWNNEGIDHAVITPNELIDAFSGVPSKRTYGGRTPKSGDDGFYTHLIAHMPIDETLIDAAELKNIMDKWVHDQKPSQRNLFTESYVKRRIEGLIIAINEAKRLVGNEDLVSR